MPAIENYDCEGTLTIGGVSMNRAAWAIVGDGNGAGGLLQLVTYAEQRGSDRILPTASGVVAYPRRLTMTAFELRLLVVGDVDLNGTPTADAQQGLAVNLKYIYDNVVAPVVSSTGTRAASLAIPGLSTLTADIHVVQLRQAEYYLRSTGSVWEGRLAIEVPGGKFA